MQEGLENSSRPSEPTDIIGWLSRNARHASLSEDPNLVFLSLLIVTDLRFLMCFELFDD